MADARPAGARRFDPEAELARLAAVRGPLRLAMAALAERLLATRGYEALCFARLADYARERLGVSARQVQELARVHRALAELPQLEAALRTNQLSWSKVRLLSEVATPQLEAAWIGRASALPVRALEAQVRAAKDERSSDGVQPDPDAACERIHIYCTPGVREKWLCAKGLAELVAGEGLSDAAALEQMVAEACSGLDLSEADSVGVAVAEPTPPARRAGRAGALRHEPAPTARAPAQPPPIVAELLAGLDACDGYALDARLRRAVRLEQTLDAEIAPLLRHVTAPEYEWSGEHYQPLSRYAPDALGMSASKARALIRLARAAQVCPELRDAYAAGRLSWCKALALLPLLLLDIEGGWRPRWVAWAQQVTVRRLERDVSRMLLLRAQGAGHRLSEPHRVQEPLADAEQQMCARVDQVASERLVWRVEREVAALYREACAALAVGVTRARGYRATAADAFEALIDTAIEAWRLRDPDAPRESPVALREGYQCAVPGCSSRRNLHEHHIRFRSAGGSDAPENRILLCAFHHLRCLHEGRMNIRGSAPDGVVFELGVRRDADPLARYGYGDVERTGPSRGGTA